MTSRFASALLRQASHAPVPPSEHPKIAFNFVLRDQFRTSFRCIATLTPPTAGCHERGGERQLRPSRGAALR